MPRWRRLLDGLDCASKPTAKVGDALGHPSLALRVKQMTGRAVRSSQTERLAEDIRLEASCSSPAVAGYVYSYEPLRRFPMAPRRAELVGDCPRDLPSARAEEEAIAPAFFPIPVRARARCFLISDAETIKVTGSIFNRIFRQFRVELQKSLRHCSKDGRNTEEPSAAATFLHERGRISAWTTSRPIAAELMLNTCKTATPGGA